MVVEKLEDKLEMNLEQIMIQEEVVMESKQRLELLELLEVHPRVTTKISKTDRIASQWIPKKRERDEQYNANDNGGYVGAEGNYNKRSREGNSEDVSD